MPTTLSEPVSTTIFMKPLPSDPEMVFFMGLQGRMGWMMWVRMMRELNLHGSCCLRLACNWQACSACGLNGQLHQQQIV